MNKLCFLIWEPRLYEFKLCHNIMEVTKNICLLCEGENADDHCTVKRWVKKFASSGRPKTVYCEAMLQAIELI